MKPPGASTRDRKELLSQDDEVLRGTVNWPRSAGTRQIESSLRRERTVNIGRENQRHARSERLDVAEKLFPGRCTGGKLNNASITLRLNLGEGGYSGRFRAAKANRCQTEKAMLKSGHWPSQSSCGEKSQGRPRESE
jgi:hypothetical protein